ncbi:MAG: NGG1p interacting factor NIF3 [Candidatus Omnitrophota bacterium]
MTLKELYELLVKEGMNADPRGKAVVEKCLARAKKAYQKLEAPAKEEFDTEALSNPYCDTRVLYGSLEKKIQTLLVGIDIAEAEVLLADRLNQKNEKIDAVMSHHPAGRALAGLAEVMEVQIDILKDLGVPINVVESLMSDRMAEVNRRVMPSNHGRAVDAARLLDIAFLCGHTVADNHVASYLQKLIDKEKPDTLSDVLDILRKIPEYRQATLEKAGPKIIAGEASRRAGKIFVDMTGGTEGSKDIFDKLAQAGVGTILAMHLSEEHLKKVKAEHINVIIAGHIASDNLGMNMLLDKVEKKEKLRIIECSGFKRVKRK